MFSIIKQVFVVLLNFITSLATKFVFWMMNDTWYINRPTLIDLNPVELNYYPFTISLDKCLASCSVLSPKICVSKKSKIYKY